ncbi:unnamed protein product [Mytilus coruscus]|uniref:Uncharacterized protein n=1 Tax=Mytilus coruscus TaxID=42192 RepID=A0A6J8CXK8_MYTCO|nr:unnamed protein product [Mytilus coruscus]
MQSDEFLRSNIGKSKTHESVSDVLQKSPQINEHEVEASFVKRTKLASKNPENENDSTHKIDVHFPRSVSNLEYYVPPVFVNRPKVAWDRARNKGTITDYSYAVSQNLWSLEYPSGQINETTIEGYHDEIINSIKTAEIETLPHINYKGYMKPYWNNNPTLLRNNMRSARKQWINQCHCHDSNCDAFVTYKNTKKLFRAALRKAFDEFESSTAHKLEKEIDIDQKHAWNILNRRKKKSSGCTAPKKDGILYTPILTIYVIFGMNIYALFFRLQTTKIVIVNMKFLRR